MQGSQTLLICEDYRVTDTCRTVQENFCGGQLLFDRSFRKANTIREAMGLDEALIAICTWR